MRKPALITIHVGYWLMYSLLLTVMFVLLAAPQPEVFNDFSTNFFMWVRAITPIAVVPGLVGFYAGYLILFSKYIAQKRFLHFALYGSLITICGALLGIMSALIIYPKNNTISLHWDGFFILFTIMAIMSVINMVIGIVIKGFVTAYSDIQLKEELTKQNTQIELALVKSQINPHFLFNTLNNIDTLIKSEPDRASNYLNKLSDILRFMLYDAREEPMSMSVELNYIDKYIELQRIRTNIKDYVKTDIIGDPADVVIEPLIFLPYIENAFKHAEHKKTAGAVRILWQISAEVIVFRCENTFSTHMKEHHVAKEGGLGNELMERRLRLLYPNKHHLTTKVENERYIVELTIDRK